MAAPVKYSLQDLTGQAQNKQKVQFALSNINWSGISETWSLTFYQVVKS